MLVARLLRRSVVAPGGQLLVIDYIHPPVNVLGRGRPLFELRGEGNDFQWWLASDRGLQQLLKVAGFTVDEAYLKQSEFRGRPVAPFERVTEIFPPDRCSPAQ